MKKLTTLGLALGAAIVFAGTAQAQIKMGVAGPLTGPNAAFGAQLKNGTEQAIEDINAAGGIMGQKITGRATATTCPIRSRASRSPTSSSAMASSSWSATSTPASPCRHPRSMPRAASSMISPSATNPKITERSMWNIFRTCGRDDQQGAVASAWIIKNMKGKKIAIVHDKTTYGQGLADETKKGLNKGGVKEVLYEGVNLGEKDFSALVSKIKASGADLVYWGGLHTEGGLIVRQMRDQGVKAPLMGGDGITSDEFATVGGPGVEGTLMTFSPDPRKRPEAKAIVEKFRAKKFEPEAYTLYSYAAVESHEAGRRAGEVA